MDISNLVSGYKNKSYKNKIREISKKIDGRVCHERVSILPVLMEEHGSVKTYVEIGTLHGGSLSLVSNNNIDDSLFVGIDLFMYTNFGETPKSNDPKGFKVGKDIAIKNINMFNKGNRVELVMGDSRSEETISKLVSILNNRKIDFLFIDGLHTREGVLSDFNNYSKLVSSGGYIVFDDYDDHKGVRDGVDEIVRDLDSQFTAIGNFDNEFLIIKA